MDHRVALKLPTHVSSLAAALALDCMRSVRPKWKSGRGPSGLLLPGPNLNSALQVSALWERDVRSGTLSVFVTTEHEPPISMTCRKQHGVGLQSAAWAFISALQFPLLKALFLLFYDLR